jgi:hypothetical protein
LQDQSTASLRRGQNPPSEPVIQRLRSSPSRSPSRNLCRRSSQAPLVIESRSLRLGLRLQGLRHSAPKGSDTPLRRSGPDTPLRRAPTLRSGGLRHSVPVGAAATVCRILIRRDPATPRQRLRHQRIRRRGVADTADSPGVEIRVAVEGGVLRLRGASATINMMTISWWQRKRCCSPMTDPGSMPA